MHTTHHVEFQAEKMHWLMSDRRENDGPLIAQLDFV
jgi:hypothetical protein